MERRDQAPVRRHIKAKITAEMAARECFSVRVSPFVAGRRDNTANYRSQHAERVQYPQPIFPEMDPLARTAQRAVLLVDTDAPAFLRKGEARGQPRNPGAGDLYPAFHKPNSTGEFSRNPTSPARS